MALSLCWSCADAASVSVQAFIQLGTPQDAKMMVKYYTMNPLTIRGRKIRLNICAKYKTLE